MSEKKKAWEPKIGDEFISDSGDRITVISVQKFTKGGICLCNSESFEDDMLIVRNFYITFTDLRKMKRKVLPNE